LVTSARFNQPKDILIIEESSNGIAFLLNDSGNKSIQKFIYYTPNNYYPVSKNINSLIIFNNFSTSEDLYGIGGLSGSAKEFIYLSIASNGGGSRISKLNYIGTSDFTTFATNMSMSRGSAIDSSGNLFVADTGNAVIKKITPAGTVSVFAGSLANVGSNDGQGTAAKFNSPWGLAIDSAQNLYVSDKYNSNIRKITPAGLVSTLAGPSDGSTGTSDGTGAAARFTYPTGLAVDANGNVFVADTSNNMIRKITPQGVVTTIAGAASSNNQYGYVNGWAEVAKFNAPEGIAVDSTGKLYVADTANHAIRLLEYKVRP